MNWLCSLFDMTASKVLLNGRPGSSFGLSPGLHQGDPLSPILFILAINPHQKDFLRAAEVGLLKPIRANDGFYRLSLYFDDAALFSNPDIDELCSFARILRCFGDVVSCSPIWANLFFFPNQMQR